MSTTDDRVCLVTGGGSGIGRATVQLLATGGARVVAADLDEDGAKGTVDGLDPDRSLAVAADVTSPESVDLMVAQVVERFGRLDVAVNSAGVSGSFAHTADQEIAEWQRVIDVNLTSVFLSMRAEIPAMLAGDGAGGGGGAIVNVASAAGAIGVPGMSPYSASKHGVIGLTRSAALEYARAGIRINAVLPGIVRTPMLRGFAGSDEVIDAMAKPSPIGRAAEPEEIADAIAWLCSPTSSYVTGHTLAVDGGTLAT